MNQPQHMAMANMGGPVGGGAVGQAINAGTPSNNVAFTTEDLTKKLNTAIYEYLLVTKKYEAARAILEHMPIERADQIKQSPNQRQTNGIDDMDLDNGIQDRPKDLPAPSTFSTSENSPFLLDWWCQFWELYHGNRRKGNPNTLSFVSNHRAAQKNRQQQMMANVDPNAMRTNMPSYNNGMVKSGIGIEMQKRAMAGAMANMPPAQMPQLRGNGVNQNQVNQGNPMERQNSQMDVNGQRSGSPNTGDAPSPKRARIDGNMQQLNQGRPGQPGQMPNNQVGPPSNIPPSTNPSVELSEETRKILYANGIDENGILQMDQDALRKMSAQPANVQAKSIEIYSQGIQAQMQLAMQRNNSNTNKGSMQQTANLAGPGGAAGAQSSPMSQAGVDPEFYPGGNRILPQNGNAIAAGQAGAPGATNNGNHALQDYQMQLMLLEQQNKKRLLMARQEQDSMAHPPGGGVPAPNPGMMDGMPAQMRTQMMMNGPNGPMMRPPPSSHPMPGAPMTQQQQLEMMSRHGQMMPNGNNWQGGGPQPPQGQMMPGQQQPGQGGPPGGQPGITPRQSNMPPPPAPQAANANSTQPSSPAQPPAPPTPSGQNKAKPGGNKKADNKNAKAGANKKGGAGSNEAASSDAPPTPTPPPAAAPNNVASFQQNNKNSNMTNGQSNQAAQQNNAPNGQQSANAVQPSQPDMPFGDGLGGTNDFSLEYGNPDSTDLLDNFDFDMFLNATGDENSYGALDSTFNFADGLETDI